MATPKDWSRAYARQAHADLNTHDELCKHPALPVCQRLHFLQMACEKLAKAHLCAAGSDPADLQSSHAYIAKQLPIIVRQEIARSSGRVRRFRWIVEASLGLAREIELLAPAVTDAGRRAANCEYPWFDTGNGRLYVPADYSFPNLSLILKASPAGATFLRLVRAAIMRLL